MGETLQEFIDQKGLEFTCKRVDSRPDRDENENEWDLTASHYSFTFKRGSESFSGYYSMGSALRGEPDAANVLDALVLDAECWQNACDVDEFARDMGYDEPEPRARGPRLSLMQRAARAQRAFDACREIFHGLQRLLGPEDFDKLRGCERL